MAASVELETFEKSVAPGEKSLERDLGIPVRLDPRHRLRLVGRFSTTARAKGRLRPMSSHGNHVRIGRALSFAIEHCTVEPPYDVYWEVRNAGEEAAKRNMFRGDIRKAGDTISETSSFAGSHWVQAWIVLDGVAIAADVQDVTIVSK